MARKPKLTPAEIERRKHERKADRMNAAEGLFPWELYDHSPPETADERHFEQFARTLTKGNCDA